MLGLTPSLSGPRVHLEPGMGGALAHETFALVGAAGAIKACEQEEDRAILVLCNESAVETIHIGGPQITATDTTGLRAGMPIFPRTYLVLDGCTSEIWAIAKTNAATLTVFREMKRTGRVSR